MAIFDSMLHSSAQDPRARKAMFHEFLERTASRNERAYAWCRAIFCYLLFCRCLALSGQATGSATASSLRTVASCLLIAYSTWEIRAADRGPLPRWALVLSVVLDSVVTFLALLADELAPNGSYRGILRNADMAIFYFATVSSGLRVWPSIVLPTLAVDGAGIVALVAVDGRLHAAIAPNGDGAKVLCAVYFLLAGAIAYVFASRTWILAYFASAEAVRSMVARKALDQVLRLQHEFRSLLSSAMLNADMIDRELTRSAPGVGIAERVRALRGDIRRLADHSVGLCDRMYRDMVCSDGCAPASIAHAVRAARVVVGRRFAHVRIEEDLRTAERAWALGGQAGLERVLIDLFVNACEGRDGRAATSIWIRCGRTKAGAFLDIHVSDDGPGFSEVVLDNPGHAGISSKARSSGLGLWLARTLADASGGTMDLYNGAAGGAVVHLELPRV